MCKINLHSSEDQLPIFLWTIRGFLLPLGWICPLHVCNGHLTVSCLWQMRTKNVFQSNENSEVVFKRPKFASIFRRLPSGADIFFWRPCQRFLSLLPDSLYLTQIFCTLFLLQLNCATITWFKSHYIWTLLFEFDSHHKCLHWNP